MKIILEDNTKNLDKDMVIQMNSDEFDTFATVMNAAWNDLEDSEQGVYRNFRLENGRVSFQIIKV